VGRPRILLSPDKFRGTFTAAEVCAHLLDGMRRAAVPPIVDVVPLADGGEGTLDLLMSLRGGRLVASSAPGPMGEPVEAEYLITADGAAVIESARFIGLSLVPPGRRDPLSASSRGLGVVVAAALDAGVGDFLIGLGGSATVDGGAGMAAALGYRFLDDAGRAVPAAPGELARVVSIDATMVHPGLAAARFLVLSDVASPLLGRDGAARVFGPQKGAGPGAVERLEAGLEALAAAAGRLRDTDPATLTEMAGAGAAGGLGLGCAVFLGARIVAGAPWLMQQVSYADLLGACDLVVTGEGSYDGQSHAGKVTGAVIEAAHRAGRPVVVVAGGWDGSWPPGGGRNVEILTTESVRGAPGPLGAAELRAIGRLVGERAAAAGSTRPG